MSTNLGVWFRDFGENAACFQQKKKVQEKSQIIKALHLLFIQAEFYLESQKGKVIHEEDKYQINKQISENVSNMRPCR